MYYMMVMVSLARIFEHIRPHLTISSYVQWDACVIIYFLNVRDYLSYLLEQYQHIIWDWTVKDMVIWSIYPHYLELLLHITLFLTSIENMINHWILTWRST